MKPYVLPLTDPQAEIALVGGKGASLARLANAGLPVPGGFFITTQAYLQFVAVNGLQASILQALQGLDPTQPAALERAHQAISVLFTRAAIPAELEQAVLQAYAGLPAPGPAVAVRSSATAEDLPEASFAGQQETYLNIRGAQAVLEAVKNCWASLWTARAIAYRARQRISPDEVALAVVVQLLVPADAAGILFTANPLNGARDELLINAAWGLGEAVVGGMVTPDSITIHKPSGKIIRRETAAKQSMTVCIAGGTQQQPVPASLIHTPVLSDAQALELAQFGIQIEQLYRAPVDIEWALVLPSSSTAGKVGFAILQARPVTALPEPPIVWLPPTPKGIYMRTSVVDLMPDPLSPLFISMGLPALIEQGMPVGQYLTRSKPAFEKDYFTTINSYGYMNAHFGARAWWWILTGMLPAYPRMLREMLPFWREQALPRYRQAVEHIRQKSARQSSASELWQDLNEILNAAMYYVSTLMFATMGANAGSEGLLTKVYDKFTKRDGDPPATALLMGWDNIPAQAEKSLYDLAVWCRDRADLATYISNTPSGQLAAELSAQRKPSAVSAEDWSELCNRFARHLNQYGYIVFQLDFYQPLPGDHPEPMLENIKMYLRGEGVNPHQRQQANQVRRIQTAQTMLQRLKGFKLWIFRKSLNWAQSLSQVREDALAEIGLGYPTLRNLLRELGTRLVEAGAIQSPEDIFFLEKAEVEACVSALGRQLALADLSPKVAQRKAFWQRMKAITPPPMIPLKKKYMGLDTKIWLAESEVDQSSNVLKGVAASAGKVTASARVLRGPQDFDQMRPGEVLVAATTTPAWTPLFAMASAVVTDIGGPLSHGSIVAREYGIPAVMGTGVATRRIQNGQMVTVDGTAGMVTLA